MSVLLIAGSPTTPSRSAALLDAVRQRLAGQTAGSALQLDTLNVRDLPAQAVWHANWDDAEVRRALARVAAARVLVIATPVYKAAYSGLLKAFLDLLPQTALEGKTVLPLASGGSAHHMLALDYALRPVLQALGARHILAGVYATDAQIPRDAHGNYVIDAGILARIDRAVHGLLEEGGLRSASAGFAAVPFAAAQYSV